MRQPWYLLEQGMTHHDTETKQPHTSPDIALAEVKGADPGPTNQNRWQLGATSMRNQKQNLSYENPKTEPRRKTPHFLPLRLQKPTKIKPESRFLASRGSTKQTFRVRATSKAEERDDHEGTKFKPRIEERGRQHRMRNSRACRMLEIT